MGREKKEARSGDFFSADMNTQENSHAFLSSDIKWEVYQWLSAGVKYEKEYIWRTVYANKVDKGVRRRNMIFFVGAMRYVA